MACVRCGTSCHLECWVYSGTCSTFGCGSRQAERTGFTIDAFGRVSRFMHRQKSLPGLEVPADCRLCRKGWRDEDGIECPTCEALFHQACWSAQGGCLLHRCREALAEAPADRGPILVPSVGAFLCRICEAHLDTRPSLRCPGCGRPYHQGCYTANQGCVFFWCRKGKAKGSPRQAEFATR